MKKIFFLFLFCVFCFISCNDNFTLVRADLIGSGRLSMDGLSIADQYINFPKENVIVNDSSKWNQLVEKIDSVGYTDSNYLASKYLNDVKIDFSSFTIIACFDVNRMHYGNLIISKILEYKTNIEVYLNPGTSVPGPYLFSMPEAYYIVKINKTNKPISFITK